mgnify:CR=1 FL=1
MSRRRALKTISAGGVVVLAGCSSVEGGDADPDPEPEPEPNLISIDPSPTGQSLSNDDIQALVDIFDDQPMNGAQLNSPSGEYTPRHVWKWVSEDTFMFLHFNDPEPSEATELDYFGIGVRAQFTENDRPVDTRDRDDFDELLREPVVTTLAPAEARRRVEEDGAKWLDVRTPDEYEQAHLQGATNMPLNVLRLKSRMLDPGRSYIACCDTGRRSASAAFLLQNAGLDVYVLEGGLQTGDENLQDLLDN